MKKVALIDTGSDISLIRAQQYISLGAPFLEGLGFRGIGSDENSTLGAFWAQIQIDGHVYKVLLHVVSDTLTDHNLLLGTNFLDTVEISIKYGEISARPIKRKINDELPEIFQIDITKNKEVDVFYKSNNYYRVNLEL